MSKITMQLTASAAYQTHNLVLISMLGSGENRHSESAENRHYTSIEISH